MDDAVLLLRPWVLLCRIPRRVPGGAHPAGVAAAAAHAHAQGAGEEAEAGHGEAELEAGAEHAADFSFPLVQRPRVTVMNAGPTAHPDRNAPDKYPYVLGTESSSSILLLNFGVAPFHGACLDDRPYESNLIVVSDFDFDAAGVAQGRPPTGTAERIAPRDGEQPVVTNIESIGLLPDFAVHRFLIAELLINTGSDTVRLVYIFADFDKWIQEDAPNPLLELDHGHDREWVPCGVVSHINMLWYFDLSWGLISFNPRADDDEDENPVPLLLFHPLPEGRELDMAQPGMHNTRCIAQSNGQLLYVEIITDPDGDEEAARVCVWTRTSGDNNVTIGWDIEHDVAFEEIWNDDTYIATGLPRKVPALVAVSPVLVDHVYFVLEEEERLFCVDILSCTVSEFVDEDYDLVTPMPVPPSCRFVLPWFLPPQVAPALGPFDNLDVHVLEADIIEDMANDVEEMQEEEIHEEEEMALEIDAALQEQFAHEEQQIIAEAQVVIQALVQAQAAQDAPADDEELQEAEIENEEQPEAEIHDENDEEMQEAEIDDNDEISSEEMLQGDMNLAMRMDPETASRLKAEVKENLSDMKDHPGPSQDPRDDAGKGAV
ncbi:unnamed protein product [Urochloa humidicola]